MTDTPGDDAPPRDPSYGYEAAAEAFMAARGASGRAVVEKWAASLSPGACVVDVGAGSGEPLTAALIEAGLEVFAIDAAPAMVAAFKARFPNTPIACEAAETSPFFGRTFDAAMAVGLVFLLKEDGQRALFTRMAGALKPGGRLLFSAPWRVHAWMDILTNLPSRSLGAEAYRRILGACGMSVLAHYDDEGGSHYVDAVKDRA